ncbi:MAG TPA: hypothetical protein VIT20_00435 [Propionibacteriaceae bacterium]
MAGLGRTLLLTAISMSILLGIVLASFRIFETKIRGAAHSRLRHRPAQGAFACSQRRRWARIVQLASRFSPQRVG